MLPGFAYAETTKTTEKHKNGIHIFDSMFLLLFFQERPVRFLQQVDIPLIRPFGAPSPNGRRDTNQPLSHRERVAEGRVRG
jgi:hypothetical protein